MYPFEDLGYVCQQNRAASHPTRASGDLGVEDWYPEELHGLVWVNPPPSNGYHKVLL